MDRRTEARGLAWECVYLVTGGSLEPQCWLSRRMTWCSCEQPLPGLLHPLCREQKGSHGLLLDHQA